MLRLLMVQFSQPCVTTGKTIALTFVLFTLSLSGSYIPLLSYTTVKSMLISSLDSWAALLSTF